LTSLQRFQYFVEEREAIRLKKEAGLPFPWTKDKVLRDNFFTNVNREYDRGTIFYKENILNRCQGYADLVWATLFYRLHNRVDTAILLNNGASWGIPIKKADFRRDLEAAFKATGGKLLTGAHQVAVRGDVVSYLFLRGCQWSALAKITLFRLYSCKELKEAIKELKELPGIGSFLANQVALDLSLHRVFKFSPRQEGELGPGAKMGLKMLGNPNVWALAEGLGLSWAEIEHALCEFSKYQQIKTGQSHRKRLYKPKESK
jgi:hypothetical protein